MWVITSRIWYDWKGLNYICYRRDGIHNLNTHRIDYSAHNYFDSYCSCLDWISSGYVYSHSYCTADSHTVVVYSDCIGYILDYCSMDWHSACEMAFYRVVGISICLNYRMISYWCWTGTNRCCSYCSIWLGSYSCFWG